jgi:hypothetical protein
MTIEGEKHVGKNIRPKNVLYLGRNKIKNMSNSKWSKYDSEIFELIQTIDSNTQIAKTILKTKESQLVNTDVDLLKTYIKRYKEKNKGILDACSNVGISPESTPMLWLKTKNESVRVTNPLYKAPQEFNFETLAKEVIEDLKNYVPKYPQLKREINENKRLFVFDPADIHIGKLCSAFEVGETYNNQIAVQRVLKGCKGILNEIDTTTIDKVLFVIGNDILHIDNTKRTTTSGTPQDTDGMWHSNFLIAKQLYVDIIEILMSVADVHVVYNPSNHDYTNGFFLAQVIETHFKDCKNVTFDTTIAHRKYFTYGKNLIGTTHGDGARAENLPLLMAHESKDWTNCKHKYIYTHHLHHKISKDYMGVCVETLRSPSGTDSWHHRNGYQHAPKAVEGYIHDKEHGQIMRITHIF